MERKGVFVDMLEAAKRARSTRDLPIIRTDSAQLLAIDTTINPEQWKFDMALCAQDMVLWDEKAAPAEHNPLGPPIYRLQKRSGPNISLIFRHFSVTSTADTDGRGIIRCSPNTLACQKIQIDPLGKWEAAGGD